MRQAIQIREDAFRPRPFLKWAGGKSKLIPQLEPFFPKKRTVYFEPFIGGGAVFLHLAAKGLIKKAFLNDLNSDLAGLYSVIKYTPADFIESCLALSFEYLALDDVERAEYYYDKRKQYNAGTGFESVTRAAATVFLNKTCFNGLFRVNSKGEFNVPAGRYKSPTIIDPENIYAVSRALTETEAEITCADFNEALDGASKGSFVYYDPPYRPLNKTACFTTYSTGGFDDGEQVRLASCFRKLADRGAVQMLSNSDPKNADPADSFFEELYGGFRIRRVKAARNINSSADKRGSISELLITNY
ncbi:DNA adenine methylase [Geovibrio thiophilus]|uniref:DNA adenine methylase n=1 Tax=Geovibrio thiophilus TaxID=139438 RepID=UPI0019D435A2|nr:DNA adenine methylase [Geovibrio thiophilus]